jgi:hypothetical protein
MQSQGLGGGPGKIPPVKIPRLITFHPTIGGGLLVRHERAWSHIESVRNCARDEGRPLGVGLQEQAPNHLKLRW